MIIRNENEKEKRENGFNHLHRTGKTFPSDGTVKRRGKEVTIYLLPRTNGRNGGSSRRLGQTKEVKNILAFCEGCFGCIQPCNLTKDKK